MLVADHQRVASPLAAGVASLPQAASALAATQAAWRFLNNERVTLSALVEPLRDTACTQLADSPAPFALLVHDWCRLHFKKGRKQDLKRFAHAADTGYELTTALLVEAEKGQPVAPLELHCLTGDAFHSTRPDARKKPHLDQLLPTMRAAGEWGLPKPLLHVIDREADAVDHFRQWDADGHWFLVRANNRRIKWQGTSCKLREIAQELWRQRALKEVGAADYRGTPARLFVAETVVLLDRPAKKKVKRKSVSVPGRPIELRFVVAQVRNDQGQMLAEWSLLTNVPRDVAATSLVAQCYYWRWKIESFFKLLKSHGQQVEDWQQTTGAAVTRRLLIAAMACTTVWQLLADDSLAAVEMKNVLVQLSGRQMKRKRPFTAPALLAGLWTLLSMLELLKHDKLQNLKSLFRQLPYLHPG